MICFIVYNGWKNRPGKLKHASLKGINVGDQVQEKLDENMIEIYQRS